MSSSDRPSKRRRRMYVRWHGDGLEVGRGRVLARDELGVDVAVQLAVEVVVALVLERRAARRALEALHVQVLVLDAHEHAAATNNLLCFTIIGAAWRWCSSNFDIFGTYIYRIFVESSATVEPV